MNCPMYSRGNLLNIYVKSQTVEMLQNVTKYLYVDYYNKMLHKKIQLQIIKSINVTFIKT